MNAHRNPESLVVHNSSVRLVKVLLGGLALAAASLLLIGVFGRIDVPVIGNAVQVVIGVVGVVFFGLGSFYYVYKLIVRKPALLLTSEGLTDHASATAAGFVPWSEITGVDAVTFSGQRMVAVHVTNRTRSSRG